MPVCLGIIFILSLSWASAAEKPAPAGGKQVPEIFVQTGHASSVIFLAMDKNEKYLVPAD